MPPVPQTSHYYVFSVEGDGVFPFDMLRYARAWPANEIESYKLDGREPRKIELHCLENPNSAAVKFRFASFGWRVR